MESFIPVQPERLNHSDLRLLFAYFPEISHSLYSSSVSFLYLVWGAIHPGLWSACYWLLGINLSRWVSIATKIILLFWFLDGILYDIMNFWPKRQWKKIWKKEIKLQTINCRQASISCCPVFIMWNHDCGSLSFACTCSLYLIPSTTYYLTS